MSLKLYVWEGVLTYYSDGIVFALAENVEEARKMAYRKDDCIPKDELKKRPKVYDPEKGNKMCIIMYGGG